MTKITFGMAWEKQEAKRVERLEELRRLHNFFADFYDLPSDRFLTVNIHDVDTVAITDYFSDKHLNQPLN